MKNFYQTIKNLNNIKTGNHVVLLYDNKNDFISNIIPLVKNSLKRNEKCIYIDNQDEIEKFKKELSKHISILNSYIKSEQLHFLNKEKVYTDSDNSESNQIDELIKSKKRDTLKENYNGLTIAGELSNISNLEGENKKIIFNEKFKKTTGKYEELFNSAPVGIVRTSSEGEVLSINQAMAEMAGFTNPQKALKAYNDLEKEFYVDSERRKELIDLLKNKGEVENFEFEAIDSNGEHIWLNMNAKVNEISEKYKFIIEGYVFDITEKKKIQKELEDKKQELFASNLELSAYNKEINNLNERFIKMINLFSDIENIEELNENEFLSNILKTAVEVVPEADFGSVYNYDDNAQVNFIDCVGHDLEELKKMKLSNKAFYSKKNDIEILKIDELKKRNRKYMSRDNYNSLKNISLNNIKEVMYLDLKVNGNRRAGLSLDISDDSSETFIGNSKKVFSAFYNIASTFYKLKEYSNLQKDFTKEMITSIIKMLEMYDLYTKGHSENVAKISTAIAKEMELSKEKVNDTYWAGLVHDIGKLLIPLDIINKQGQLTDEEYNIIKNHAKLGCKTLKSSDSLKHIANYVRHHHERWDGKGYPDQLVREEIPLVSQILGLADAWDAMTSRRAYRDSLGKEKAIQEIKDNKGSQFSPVVTEVFLNMIEKGKI